MSNDIRVTLSGNSTPLLPGCKHCLQLDGSHLDLCPVSMITKAADPIVAEITSLRARLAEAEARAGRAEEAVRVLGAECREHRWHVDPGHREETDNAIRTTDANPAARAAVEGAQ